MSPGGSRYTAEPNLRYANDSHVLAIGRVPANSRVLDLGVADGSVAAILNDMGCQVWGVELDPEAAEAARSVCQEVVVADLNTLELAEHFGEQQFDVVLMLDILEHLSDPATVLGRVKPVVAEGGWGIVSLPNVAHLSVRLALLNGRFSYTEMGLLDRTHLRFFTRASIEELFDSADLVIESLVPINPISVRRAALLVGPFRDMRYPQFAVVARPRHASASATPAA